ncbi:hypothetical protein [Synechococcus sp. WH 8016]|jgi:hypothetical protein|uniref:hypothetical protein n=1 Tax=Synechococcus sp. WH 8016 TaxID=166318 RepID=UPI00022D8E5F|nr:hypothetical protein [Synechococcus sp. WH 8016]EHA62296.1 hypothetical protein Syn8016DRAFT_1591 [Synechococcus sp. WH 8016]
MDPRKPILWVHEEALGPANPALQDYPDAPGLFVFDDAWIQEQAISRKRIGFLYESAVSLPLTLRRGDVASEVLRFAQRHGADAVVTSAVVDPRLQRIAAAIDRELPLWMLDPDPFVSLAKPPRLGRFSRYWREAEAVVWEGF